MSPILQAKLCTHSVCEQEPEGVGARQGVSTVGKPGTPREAARPPARDGHGQSKARPAGWMAVLSPEEDPSQSVKARRRTLTFCPLSLSHLLKKAVIL